VQDILSRPFLGIAFEDLERLLACKGQCQLQIAGFCLISLYHTVIFPMHNRTVWRMWYDLLCPRLQNVTEICVTWAIGKECANKHACYITAVTICRLIPRSICPRWYFHLLLKHFNNRRLNISFIIWTLLERFCLCIFHETSKLLVPYFERQDVC
jgi:hypothetical protein